MIVGFILPKNRRISESVNKQSRGSLQHKLYQAIPGKVTPQALKGIKGNEGNDLVEFPYFLHFPIG
jgi:hypothetical protein